MGEFSLFWPTGTTGDGTSTYTDSQLFAWLRRTFNSDMYADRGPLKGYNGELAVTAGVGKVTVATGAAYVYGIPYELDAALDVTIPTPVANTRVDRIVLRADWTAKTVRVTRIAGTEGAGAPAITQTPGSVYDVKLAQVSITTGGVITVTDERQFCRFASEVASENLADGAVTAAKLASNSVGSTALADGAVTSNKLAAAAVASDKLAAGAVGSTALADGAVVTAKLATGVLSADATGRGKMADGFITTAKIADGQVTAAKIADRSRALFVPAVYAKNVSSGTHLDWGGASDPGWVMPDNTKCEVAGSFQVPRDYVSDMGIAAVVYPAASGNLYCENLFTSARAGETMPQHQHSTTYQAVGVTANTVQEVQDLAGSAALQAVVIDEYITLRWTRDATNAADTVNNSVRFLGWLVYYTADS